MKKIRFSIYIIQVILTFILIQSICNAQSESNDKLTKYLDHSGQSEQRDSNDSTYSNSKYVDAQHDEYKRNVGVILSNISGYGAYYQEELWDSFRVKAVGLIYFYDLEIKNKELKDFNYDIGLEIQRDIKVFDSRRVYFVLGGYYYYDNSSSYESESKNQSRKLHSISVGTGIGVQYIYHRVSYNFDIGYKYFYDRAKRSENGGEMVKEFISQLKLGGGVGIGFVF